MIADLLTSVNAVVVRRRKPLPFLTRAEVHSDNTTQVVLSLIGIYVMEKLLRYAGGLI